MMKIPAAYCLSFAALLLSQGCSNTEPGHDDGLTLCQEPRPEICTQDYNPVCGKLTHGEKRTYPNACAACSESEVIGHRPGECP